MATKYPRATEDQFTASRFHTAKDKALTVNATVRFLETGLEPFAFTKRAYHFFHQTLSMAAEYDIHGFASRHFEDDFTKARFLEEVRDDVARYARLDPERNSDMAALFVRGDFGEDGPYAALLEQF